MEESDFSATAYDRVYAAERPELFFKAMPQKVAGPGDTVGIRRDAKWNVPEPELALVINSKGRIVGHTIGNDMSSRDIEGENLLYLPQAKIYDHSCALGPWIALGKHNYVLHQNCEAIARKMGNALCAPIVKFVPEGNVEPPSSHMTTPGTLSMRQSTFNAILTDLVASLRAHGVPARVFDAFGNGDRRRYCDDRSNRGNGAARKFLH